MTLFPVFIPDEFAHRMAAVHGEDGVAWLARFPRILADAVARWSLRLGTPYEPWTYSFVTPATRAGGPPVVLKIAPPDPELRTGIDMLRHCGGRGVVRLLDADAEAGVLLMERVHPGTPLSRLADDEEATRIAARVLRRLHRPPPAAHCFPSVADWARGLARHRERYGGSGPLPAPIFARAEALFVELFASAGPPRLLHGDLHHDNILASSRDGWLAIDPKGVVGEAAYDTAALLRNPLALMRDHLDRGRILARRVRILAEELNEDTARIRDWGIAHAVLSAVWSAESDPAGGGPAIAVAETLAAL